MKRTGVEIKVGAFALVMIVIAIWATLKVSDRGALVGGGYSIEMELKDATGLKKKAPVLMSGVEIGLVEHVGLTPDNEAIAKLSISKSVNLPVDTGAILKTKGFLGETYVDLVPGKSEEMLKGGDLMKLARRSGDINTLVTDFSTIADDIKVITSSLRGAMGTENNPGVLNMLKNWENLSNTLNQLAVRNEQNIDKITTNMAEMTTQLKELIGNSRERVSESMDHISSIAAKIDKGQGTVGKLINDDETVQKLNSTLDSLKETLGGFKNLETEIGYHAEYLGTTKDFKNYVSLNLRPAPDRALMLEIVSNPNPDPTYVDRTTDVTVNGVTSTVKTTSATIDRSRLLFSAQLAKKFYDLTARGGIIESTGGFGFDYDLGPADLSFSAYDFTTSYGDRPHLKISSDLNFTKNIYAIAGADDFINRSMASWFVGLGFKFSDDDIKSLVTAGGAIGSLSKK